MKKNSAAAAMGKKGKSPEVVPDSAYLEAVTQKRIALFQAIQARQAVERLSIAGDPIRYLSSPQISPLSLPPRRPVAGAELHPGHPPTLSAALLPLQAGPAWPPPSLLCGNAIAGRRRSIAAAMLRLYSTTLLFLVRSTQ
jgi:hypothetical protein